MSVQKYDLSLPVPAMICVPKEHEENIPLLNPGRL